MTLSGSNSSFLILLFLLVFTAVSHSANEHPIDNSESSPVEKLIKSEIDRLRSLGENAENLEVVIPEGLEPDLGKSLRELRKEQAEKNAPLKLKEIEEIVGSKKMSQGDLKKLLGVLIANPAILSGSSKEQKETFKSKALELLEKLPAEESIPLPSEFRESLLTSLQSEELKKELKAKLQDSDSISVSDLKRALSDADPSGLDDKHLAMVLADIKETGSEKLEGATKPNIAGSSGDSSGTDSGTSLGSESRSGAKPASSGSSASPSSEEPKSSHGASSIGKDPQESSSKARRSASAQQRVIVPNVGGGTGNGDGSGGRRRIQFDIETPQNLPEGGSNEIDPQALSAAPQKISIEMLTQYPNSPGASLCQVTIVKKTKSAIPGECVYAAATAEHCVTDESGNKPTVMEIAGIGVATRVDRGFSVVLGPDGFDVAMVNIRGACNDSIQEVSLGPVSNPHGQTILVDTSRGVEVGIAEDVVDSLSHIKMDVNFGENAQIGKNIEKGDSGGGVFTTFQDGSGKQQVQLSGIISQKATNVTGIGFFAGSDLVMQFFHQQLNGANRKETDPQLAEEPSTHFTGL